MKKSEKNEKNENIFFKASKFRTVKRSHEYIKNNTKSTKIVINETSAIANNKTNTSNNINNNTNTGNSFLNNNTITNTIQNTVTNTIDDDYLKKIESNLKSKSLLKKYLHKSKLLQSSNSKIIKMNNSASFKFNSSSPSLIINTNNTENYHHPTIKQKSKQSSSNFFNLTEAINKKNILTFSKKNLISIKSSLDHNKTKYNQLFNNIPTISRIILKSASPRENKITINYLKDEISNQTKEAKYNYSKYLNDFEETDSKMKNFEKCKKNEILTEKPTSQKKTNSHKINQFIHDIYKISDKKAEFQNKKNLIYFGSKYLKLNSETILKFNDLYSEKYGENLRKGADAAYYITGKKVYINSLVNSNNF